MNLPWRRGRAGRRSPTPLFLAFIGGLGAYLAQSERLPLVAVVSLAVAVAPFVSRTGSSLKYRVGVYQSRTTCYVGGELQLVFTVLNQSPATTSATALTMTAGDLVLGPYSLPELAPGEKVRLEHRVTATARRGPVEVSCTGEREHRLLGAPRRWAAPDAGGLLLQSVRPVPLLPPAQVVERLTRPSDEGRGSGKRGSVDPMALRQFASGDPLSSIHWRSTARAGTPVVMEREQPLAGLLVLLVAANGAGPDWEAAVARAAGLVQAAAATAVPVEVVSTVPGKPAGHEAVQEWLAALGAAGAADAALVGRAARVAEGGLVAVLSADRSLAGRVAAAVGPQSVVDLMADPW